MHEPDEIMPEFYAPLENWTVTQGRDIYFTCTVNNLGKYKVINNRSIGNNKRYPINNVFSVYLLCQLNRYLKNYIIKL